MSELEQRLNALMNNPQLMQQIASMAQAMGTESQNQQTASQEPAVQTSGFDPKLLQTMAQTLGKAGIDSNQTTLLQALSPYVSPHRLRKLQRAMEAARLAGAASAFLNAGGLQMLSGR